MIDDTDPQVESGLRRRAALLLGALAVVAVLLAVIMSTVLGSSGSSNANGSGPAPLDSAINALPSTGGASQPAASRAGGPGSSTTPAANSSVSSSASSSSSTAHHGRATCPTSHRCALDGDIGDAVAAINTYRTQHGQRAVPGMVSAQAQRCALSNGGSCSGSWAESQVPGPDGAAAVKKIIAFGKLLDPKMKSFEVGWAYDPPSKQYFFAIVRND